MEAVAVAGAGAAVGATIKIMLENLLSYPMEEIGLLRYFKKDLQKLKEYVTTIKKLLEDAEMKQVTDKSVQCWLMKLEDVAFDADYVFDQLNYQHLRKEVRRGSKMKKKVRCFFPNSKSFSFRHRMARKIKNIRDKLILINQEAKELSLQARMANIDAPARGAGTDALAYLETSSLLSTDPVFVGRENDARKIVEMVCNSPTEKVVSVLPIVGMGGLGKTTLARIVFHDRTIISRFENRIWVYVSENFVPKTVFKKVFESLARENIDGSDEFVLGKLREKIGEKRYLLVLDDVWSEDVHTWDHFINSLEAISPVKGNVVILTTRKINVATTVKTIDTHELGVLTKDDCWGIIKAKAFGGDNFPPEFEIVGKNIAERCGGLPLAAKVVGSLLRNKPEVDWRLIENKWLPGSGGDTDGISKILKLSFDNLSSPLVQKCFEYCSILPKGWFIRREELIHLWMAEGFLQTGQEKEKEMEIEGDRVLNVLLQSSLIQVQEKNPYGEVIRGYGMHDLVHDLASSILNSKFLDGAHRVRYTSITLTDESSGIPKERAECLRGLFFSGKISGIMLSNLKCLHVLILNYGELNRLPIEIGSLISLRLLDISHTKMEYLPDSIGDLYHLQTLRATKEYAGSGCLRELPNTSKFLTSLRHLYIPNIELPPEIGKLSSLQTLPYFQVDPEKGCGIMELGSLKNLKGEIEIHHLQRVRDKEEAKTADLLHKTNILKLKLAWYKWSRRDDNIDEIVLECLEPHRNLTSLEIEGFKGSSFPSWTLRMDFDNLLELKLSACPECKEIPMMGHLPRLKSLYVSELPNVKSIGSSLCDTKEDEANKEAIIVFPSLEKLVLDNLWNLTSLVTEEELPSSSRTQPRDVSVFRRLEYLEISECRQLKSVPSHFPVLKELVIHHMESVPFASICGPKLTTLTKLSLSYVNVGCLTDGFFNNNRGLLKMGIARCNNLTCLPSLGGGGASLRKLVIEFCFSFEKLPEDVDKFNALEDLTIKDCPSLESIAYPSGTQLSSQGFTSLRHLKFQSCYSLTNLSCEMLESCALSLEKLKLEDLDSLTNLPQVMSILNKMSLLMKLTIDGVPKLRDVVVEIGSLPGLKYLKIGGRKFRGDYVMEESDGLPELQHLTSLHELWLEGFGIEVLPEWIGRLSSLRRLELWENKKLRHLPSKKAMHALTNLNSLRIYRSPLLEHELTQEEEWSKVSHIDFIDVSYRRLTADDH